MKKIILVTTFFISSFSCYSQSTEHTKQLVDSIRISIPYPKYNINDIVYIAFIKNPKADVRFLTDKDIEVVKARIVEMCVVNGNIWGTDGDISGLFIGEYGRTEKTWWMYQYVDATIEHPLYGDFSNKLYPEERFKRTPEEAVLLLKKDFKE